MINGIKCCKNCEKRHQGCHSDCAQYLDEKQQYEEYKVYVAREKERFSSRMRVISTIRAHTEQTRRY